LCNQRGKKIWITSAEKFLIGLERIGLVKSLYSSVEFLQKWVLAKTNKNRVDQHDHEKDGVMCAYLCCLREVLSPNRRTISVRASPGTGLLLRLLSKVHMY
jgi:hypothetical protein